jgi:hypothetical protein
MALTKVTYSMIDGAVANVKDYGAIGNGVADDGPAIALAMAASKSVFFPIGVYKSTQTLTMQDGQEFYGASKWASQLKFAGNINGLVMATQCSINDMRIVGNASMTTDKCCVDFGRTRDAYRSNIRNCIIGGESASLGDPGNIRAGGAAMAGGYSSFSAIFDAVYFFNANVGYENAQTGTQVNNALHFNSCEFHACGVGSRIVLLNGILFSQCTFQGNDENGLIVGDSRSAILSGCYFEGNHRNNTSPVKADFYIGIANNMTGFGTATGKSITIKEVFMYPGTYTAYGIYVEGQGNVNIDNAFFGGYGATPPIYIAGNVADYGRIANTYTASVGAIVINNNVPFMLENNRRTGEDTLAWARAAKHYTNESSTASVSAGGTANLFAPVAGEMYIVNVKNQTNTNTVSSVALVQGCNSGSHILTSLVSTGASMAISAGNVQLTNNLAGAATFDWSAIRIQ